MPRKIAGVHFELDSYLHRRLQEIARVQDRTLSAVMRQAALQYVNSYPSLTRSIDLKDITNATRASINRKP
jgi:predicted transcriptional regulator